MAARHTSSFWLLSVHQTLIYKASNVQIRNATFPFHSAAWDANDGIRGTWKGFCSSQGTSQVSSSHKMISNEYTSAALLNFCEAITCTTKQSMRPNSASEVPLASVLGTVQQSMYFRACTSKWHQCLVCLKTAHMLLNCVGCAP